MELLITQKLIGKLEKSRRPLQMSYVTILTIIVIITIGMITMMMTKMIMSISIVGTRVTI